MAKRALLKNKQGIYLFLDANVIIDTADTGSPNHEDAVELLGIATDNAIPLYIASISIVFYAHTLKRFRTTLQIQTGINSIMRHCGVLDVTAHTIQAANQAEQRDFEDAVQYFTALHQGNITHIVSNDRHFPHLDIPVISPAQAIDIIQL